MTRPIWPCLLPNVGVAVAPVRNLTGNPEQQYLVEAFTDDLVTDLLRHGRGLCLKPLGDERGAIGNPTQTNEREFDYIVTGSAQSSAPGMLRVNMRITDAATSEYLWAGRHEFRPEDLAPIQTRITRRISRELHVLLLQAASRRALLTSAWSSGLPSVCLKRRRLSKAGPPRKRSAEAQRWYLAALARDPRSVEALVGLGPHLPVSRQQPVVGRFPSGDCASDLGRKQSRSRWRSPRGMPWQNVSKECCTRRRDNWRMAARAFQQAIAMDQG